MEVAELMTKYQIIYYLREDGRLVKGNVYESLQEATQMAEMMRRTMKKTVRGAKIEEIEED